ncbi:MAG: hypothetical protein ABL949_12180 [Fimbriimonadaceae bacterium]
MKSHNVTIDRTIWHKNAFGIFVLGSLLVMSMALFFPLGYDNPNAAVKTHCLSNMKQTATATGIYMLDHDERMPLANWMPSLLPYSKDHRVTECPLIVKNRRRFGYALKGGNVGLNTHKLKDLEKTVMYFETDTLTESAVADLTARCARHRKDGSIVSFLDTTQTLRAWMQN